MPEAVLLKYLVEITLGLFVLHANRILHRDIKPANVFVGANDTIKLGDLGVAKLLSGEAQAKTSIGTPNVRRNYAAEHV
jgi:NIMA (never in mitosis gene a)-related kinase